MRIGFSSSRGMIYPVLIAGEKVKFLERNIQINDFYANIERFLDELESNGTMVENAGNTVIPVNPSKILCPALNFTDHSGETGQKSPEFPYFFPKFPSSVTSYDSDIIRPGPVRKLDYEGEIAAIISRKTRDAGIQASSQSIAGYAVVNDVSARDIQNQFSEGLGKNWIMGKAADTFLPVSSQVYIGKEDDLDIRTSVNGAERQNGNTGQMIFSFPEMISYISKFITLFPGDMILSGTPPGVAMSGKYPFLEDGDVVRVESKKIGYISNMVRDNDKRNPG